MFSIPTMAWVRSPKVRMGGDSSPHPNPVAKGFASWGWAAWSERSAVPGVQVFAGSGQVVSSPPALCFGCGGSFPMQRAPWFLSPLAAGPGTLTTTA